MQTSLLSLIIWLSPLLPEQIPAKTIYMGEHVKPVIGERSKCKSLTGFCMTLTLRDFLKVKDAVQNQPGLCHLAVTSTASACKAQALSLADIVSQRTLEDQQIIDSYKIKLNALELTLAETEEKRFKWKWVSASLVGLSAILTTTIIIIKK